MRARGGDERGCGAAAGRVNLEKILVTVTIKYLSLSAYYPRGGGVASLPDQLTILVLCR